MLAFERSEALVQSWLAQQENARYPCPQQLSIALAGGRRLRMILALLSGRLVSSTEDLRIDNLAVALELGHKASLILDDVVDGDLHRNGKPSFVAQAGLNVSLVTANFLLSESLTIAQELGVGSEMISVFRSMSTAQAREVLGTAHDHLSSLDINLGKSGMLGAASAGLACKIAGGTAEQYEQIAQFGSAVAELSQLANDLSDFSLHDSYRPLGSEFATGRRSPVAWLCFAHITSKYGEDPRVIQQAGSESITADQMRMALQAQTVQREVRAIADDLNTRALRALESFVPSPFRDALRLGALTTRAAIETHLA